MPIFAVTLFGSRARGDANRSSDIDLLLVTNEGTPRHTSMGNISMSFYPLKDLKARARSGNLFLCHVLREGRPVYDPEGLFAALTNEFKLRTSYECHIRQAADLAWLLARFGERWGSEKLLRRRIAWTVRTILIGRSAEAGNPVFAPKALARVGPSRLTRRLIAEKDADQLSRGILENLEEFLTELKLPDPLPAANTPELFSDLFSQTGNAIGRHFISKITYSVDSQLYS
jgi:hypothetical protein